MMNRMFVAVLSLALSCADAAASVCAGPATLEGIDVSSFEGDIDWPSVAATKSFAFARVSDGLDFSDPKFAQNYAGIRAAGMVRGVYQIFRPGEDPVAQANLLLQSISVPLPPGDLPPALDVEVTDGQSPATIAANIQTWSTTVQNATGKAPLIFVSPFFWNSNVQSSALASNPLWIVQWNVSCPTLPTPWNAWLFWMHSNAGSVAGVTGDVDLDTFNGSEQDLLDMVDNDRVFASGFDPH